MDYGTQSYDPYDEPYSRPPERINYFAWTVAILLLTGFALAAWLGSFYIFNQPERPDSYRILQKLHKIEPPKRFELTAAPAGEFLNASQLYERYVGMGAAELAKTNAELLRNYIRNFQQVRGLVPYVVGRYTIIAVRELGPDDVFPSGMAALTAAVDSGEVLMEHVYPAKPEALPLMKQTLTVGLEVKLERTHDVSAVIHAERLIDGRILVTAVPLLYGSYTVTRGLGTFRLEPPPSLNLVGGWPLFKSQERASIEQHLAEYRQEMAVAQAGPIPVPGPGASATPPPARNELVRIEQARPVAPLARPRQSLRAMRSSRKRRQRRKAKKAKNKSSNLRRRQRLPRRQWSLRTNPRRLVHPSRLRPRLLLQARQTFLSPRRLQRLTLQTLEPHRSHRVRQWRWLRRCLCCLLNLPQPMLPM